MNARDDAKFPPVALWQINAMRFLFLLMAFIVGGSSVAPFIYTLF